MEEWKEYKLGEIFDFNNGLSKGGKFFGHGYDFVSFKTVFKNHFLPNTLDDLVESSKKEREKFSIKEGDVFLTRTSETQNELAYSCVALKDYPNATYNGFTKRLRPNGKIKIDSIFSAYFFRSAIFRNQVTSMSNMVTRASLSNEMLDRMSIKIPSYDLQKTIGKILFSFDAKIQLNKRINDNLEQQAQALFKSWFVEKPNPQWTKGSLSDIASFVGGYSYKGDELVDSSNTGMATIKNYNRSGGFKTDGFKAINPSDKVKNAQYAELFEILVAHTDLTQNAEVIGNAELVLSLGEYNKIIFSMDLVKVLPSSSFPYRFLIAAMLKNKLFKGHCQGYVNGTTVLHLNKKALPEYKVMIPTDTEAKKMNEILGGYYKRMSENLKENDMLEQLRDTILPKLMSGELKINDLNC